MPGCTSLMAKRNGWSVLRLPEVRTHQPSAPADALSLWVVVDYGTGDFCEAHAPASFCDSL